MKLVAFAAVSVLICISAGSLWADVPHSAPAMQLYDGANPMDPGRHSIPCVVDWNNDGKKDIVVGVYTYTNDIWLYLNTGTNEAPVFNGSVNIEDNGVPISTTFG